MADRIGEWKHDVGGIESVVYDSAKEILMKS